MFHLPNVTYKLSEKVASTTWAIKGFPRTGVVISSDDGPSDKFAELVLSPLHSFLWCLKVCWYLPILDSYNTWRYFLQRDPRHMPQNAPRRQDGGIHRREASRGDQSKYAGRQQWFYRRRARVHFFKASTQQRSILRGFSQSYDESCYRKTVGLGESGRCVTKLCPISPTPVLGTALRWPLDFIWHEPELFGRWLADWVAVHLLSTGWELESQSRTICPFISKAKGTW